MKKFLFSLSLSILLLVPKINVFTGIALDATSAGDFANTSSLTWSHTITGSNTELAICMIGDVAGGSDDISSVTFNGVSATLVAKVTSPVTRFLYLYHLTAPASGTHSIVITASSSHGLAASVTSYTGVSQTGQPEVSATNSNVTGVVTTSVTTSTNNAWLIGCGEKTYTGASMNAGSNTTIRTYDPTLMLTVIGDSNADQTPAGSHSLSMNDGAGALVDLITASFAPAGGAGPVYPNGLLLNILHIGGFHD